MSGPALPESSPAPAAEALARRRILLLDERRELGYVEAGEGSPVVLIHGALTHLDDMLLGPFEKLALRHRVIAIDRPGHGVSTRIPLVDASPWRQAAIVREALKRLGAVHPVIVGHSFGGAVALAYALAYGAEIAGVAALAPIVWPEPRLELALFGPRATPGLAGLATVGGMSTDPIVLAALWRAMFLPQTMPERFRQLFSFDLASRRDTTIATGEDAAAIASSLWRSVLGYPFCRTPVRILGGDRDVVINNSLHGAALARILPSASFQRLPGLGHMVHHFAQDEILAVVEDLARGGGPEVRRPPPGGDAAQPRGTTPAFRA